MFAQLIEFTTDKPDEIRRVLDDWQSASDGSRTAKRVMLAHEHDDGNKFYELVVFDSYEEAMRNSEMPVTQEFARRMGEVIDGEPRYVNLDVMEERQL